MKKMIIISALCIATLFTSEKSYAIIFTGPARRQDHREQEQQAYMAGMMSGQDMQSQDDDENYTDDTDVAVQALSQEQGFGNSQVLTPEQNVDVQANFNEPAHELEKTNEQNKSETISQTEKQAEPVAQQPTELAQLPLVAANHEAEQPAPAPAEVKDSVRNEKATEDHGQAIPEQATHAVENQEPEQAVHDAIQPEVKQTTSVPTIDISKEKEEKLAPIEEKLAPAVETKTETEQIKIVKVYPVYEAIDSAFQNIKSMVADIIRYLENAVRQNRKK